VATEADAETVALLQISWWRAAYATMLPAEVLGVDPAILTTSWSARIPLRTVLLATEGSEAVGFAAVDPVLQTHPDGDGPARSIGSIDVLGVVPRWSRRGHGGRLMATAAALLRDRGAAVGSWWVPQDDPSVAAFLAGVGWAASGERRVLDTGQGTLAEIRYGGNLDLILI
jgi:GNAT superfamily N-acetyltransferase